LETISNVETEFEYKRSITLASQVNAKNQTFLPVEDSPKTSNIDLAEPRDDHEPFNDVTERMVQSVKDSEVKAETFLRHRDRMFLTLSWELLKEGPRSRGKMGLAHRIMVDFFQKLEINLAFEQIH
jgi:hypothetical protein